MTRRAGPALVAAVLALSLTIAPTASLARATVSFTQVEQQYMCIECHEALNVARSPESYSERAYLRSLIAHGLTAGQIKTQMVGAYGQAVLATPPASGFNLTIYILPPAIVLLGVAGLLFALPRWRQRSRAADADPLTATSALSADDARRLDEDLARRA